MKSVRRTANLEQSHRGIKHRYYPTLGFGEFEAAQRFCQVVDEVNNFGRPRNQMGEFGSLSDQKNRFLDGIQELEVLFYSSINI